MPATNPIYREICGCRPVAVRQGSGRRQRPDWKRLQPLRKRGMGFLQDSATQKLGRSYLSVLS